LQAERDDFFLSLKKEIPLTEGERLANDFIALTRDFYQRIEIGGSIRRKAPIVHDIDLCAIAKRPVSEFDDEVKKVGGKVVRFGGEYATILFHGVQINVLFATKEAWGASLMWSTGPKGHTIGMNIKAENLGLKFNRTGIYRRSDDTLMPTPTEKDVAELLHWEYKPPETRGTGEKGLKDKMP
jgi:DNA polymerase/3'-5' exonuclease PolX